MFTTALLLGCFALASHAQSSSSLLPSSGGAITGSSSSTTSAPPVVAQTTMNLFIDGSDSEQYLGSIVSADSCETIIALRCTAGDYGVGVDTVSCNPAQSALATYGPDYFKLSSAASANGAQLTVSGSCSLAGTTKAVCFASIGASADGQRTSLTSTYTRSGGGMNYYQVPITAGANKVNGLASCTSTGNAAAPTGVVEVFKVLVVPGAAAILAGLHAFA